MNRQHRRKIIALELKAATTAAATSKLQQKALQSIEKQIVTKVIEIVGLKAGNPSPTLIAAKRAEISNLLTQSFGELSAQQQTQIEEMLSKIYKSTRVEIDGMFGKTFDLTNDFQLKSLLSRPDNNLTLSNRIWSNNTAISQRINKDIGRMLFNNLNPEEIKLALANDFKVSYSAADRLIRTEGSKFYNNAALDSYKSAGIEEVEFLAESDACEEQCQPNDGKIFPIGEGEIPPLHPNCRCTILPVIK